MQNYLKLGILPRSLGLCKDLVKIFPDSQGLRSILPRSRKEGVLHHNQRAEPERARRRCGEQEVGIKGNLQEYTSCAPGRRASPQLQIAGCKAGGNPTEAVCTRSSPPWFLHIFCPMTDWLDGGASFPRLAVLISHPQTDTWSSGRHSCCPHGRWPFCSSPES